jgi:hypothetical protein
MRWSGSFTVGAVPTGGVGRRHTEDLAPGSGATASQFACDGNVGLARRGFALVFLYVWRCHAWRAWCHAIIAANAGEHPKANALALLTDICRFELEPSNRQNPLQPFIIMAGRRSLYPSDFDKSQLDALTDFSKEVAAEPGYKEKKFSAGARSLLLCHGWPGNIRELLNTLKRAAICSDGGTITAEDVREALLPARATSQSHILDKPLGGGFNLPELLTETARSYHSRDGRGARKDEGSGAGRPS